MSEAPARRRAISFILVTLVLDAMGIGLILPVMPDLLEEITGGTLARAAIWGGILSTAFAVMQFLLSPLLGALSDRFGRRPVLLISLAVMAVDYLAMAVAHTIWLLLVLRIIAGATAATQSAATAFMADVSPPEKKSANFGLVGAAFGIGFVLGPVIGGLLAEFGTRAPFYAAAALAALNFAWGAFVLPETVTARTRRAFDPARANPLGAFRSVGRLPNVTRLLILFFAYEFAFIAYPSVWSYFTAQRFGWDPGMIGLSLALFGIAVAAVQGGLIRVALARFGERGTILYGFVFNFLAFVFLVVNDLGWLTLIFTPLSALGAVVTPALQGRMSRIAADDQQGELQGVIASARSVAAILSPLVMTQVFAVFSDGAGLYLPGAPFALSAILMLVCLAIFLRASRDVSMAKAP